MESNFRLPKTWSQTWDLEAKTQAGSSDLDLKSCQHPCTFVFENRNHQSYQQCNSILLQLVFLTVVVCVPNQKLKSICKAWSFITKCGTSASPIFLVTRCPVPLVLRAAILGRAWPSNKGSKYAAMIVWNALKGGFQHRGVSVGSQSFLYKSPSVEGLSPSSSDTRL